MKNVKEQIQMHIDKARQLAADAGMELEDFLRPEGPEMEDEGYEEGGEEEMPEEKPPVNKGKVALIIAKMKKAKGE